MAVVSVFGHLSCSSKNAFAGSLRAFLQILLRQQRLRHRASRAGGLVRNLPGEIM